MFAARSRGGAMTDTAAMHAVVREVIAQLEREPHDTILGLKRRYFYRRNFVLLEHLTARGLAANVERLRRRGEGEHAHRLAAAWKHSNFPTVSKSGG
jgi:low affinity Fe/Cu permease